MNERELVIKNELEKRGVTVLQNGWPDFLCYRETTPYRLRGFEPGITKAVFAVEVKTENDRLRPNQEIVHKILRLARIPVYVIRNQKEIDLKGRHLLTHSEIMGFSATLKNLQDSIAQLEQEIEKRKAALLSLQNELKASILYLRETGTLLDEKKESSITESIQALRPAGPDEEPDSADDDIFELLVDTSP